jgi:hypothetical protein
VIQFKDTIISLAHLSEDVALYHVLTLRLMMVVEIFELTCKVFYKGKH